MTLVQYRKKRNFKITSEPEAKIAKGQGFSFVVQEHHASHLHYDFRLELDGVLKSWAVPKGPPTEPKQKRLAVQVEDHPVDYGSFEGEIPKGEYGAGHVLIWDKGVWQPHGKSPQKDLDKGRLEFTLTGERLTGDWLLIRTGKAGETKGKNWLLIKRSSESLPEKTSAPSAAAKIQKKSSRVAKKVAKKSKTVAKASVKPPLKVEPQLARLVTKPPTGNDWLHEIKFDGYRTIARIEKGEVKLLTRSGLDWTHRYGPIKKALEKLKVENAILDGEIACIDEKGRTDFQNLQNALEANRTDELLYYVFDLLHLNNNDVSNQPLIERKELLKKVLKPLKSEKIVYSEHWLEPNEGSRGDTGTRLWKESCRLGLEGIISKQTSSSYEPGRGASWVKSKCGANQEFVVVGFTTTKHAGVSIGALLLAAYDKKGVLTYVGRVGTGFNQTTSSQIMKLLQPLIVAKPLLPTDNVEISAVGVKWVKPKLVAQVKFSNWTETGVLRHPSFVGLREDKPAKEVKLDRDAVAITVDEPEKKKAVKASKKSSTAPPRPATRSSAKPSKAKSKLSGLPLTISHPDRIVFPKTQVTKQMVAEYYNMMSEEILSYLEDRPLSLLRCPGGAGAKCFFQKHVAPEQSQFVVTKKFDLKEQKNKSEEIMYIDSNEGLISLVQMGVLELHNWGSRIPNIERPDMLVFDLDPSPGVSWAQIREGAFAIKDLLDHLKLKSFLKTTGGKGLHIHVPIVPKYTWDEAKMFCKTIAANLENREPKLYTTELLKVKRTNKIFIDYLRNGFGATAIVPFFVRAREGAPVAWPILWKELTIALKPDQFRLADVMANKKLRAKDPWKGMSAVKQDLSLIDSYRKQK